MLSTWSAFVTALETRGVSFDSVSHGSDRRSVIHAVGFKDPLEIAVIETEWASRVKRESSATMPSENVSRDRNSGGGGGGASAAGLSAAAASSAALLASHPEQLSSAPEEVQDTAMATELLYALVGVPGTYFALRGGATFEATTSVPLAIRATVTSALSIAEAFRLVSQAECSEFGAESLVSMALGEVLSEVTANYAHNVSEIQKRCVGRSMPLLLVVAEAQRIGHHLLRIKSMLPAIQGSLDGQQMGGGQLLNLLHQQYLMHSGSRDDERLLAVLLRRAAKPYLRILRQWVQEGVLNDPYNEFFVCETASHNASSRSSSATADIKRPALNMSIAAFRDLVAPTEVLSGGGVNGRNAAGGDASQVPEVYHYDRRFQLDKAKIPQFLLSQGRVAKMVFYSGKYCCLLREFNGSLPDLSGLASQNEEAWEWSNADTLHRLVEECYHRSSGAIIRLLRSPSVDLIGHLESLKSYFLHQRGDWLVDFLDTADELLYKSPVQVKAQSIRVLLQSAIAKSCASDPYHIAVGCSFADTTFSQYIELSLRQNGQPPRGSGRLSTMHVETRRCIELLQLDVELRWPLTLILDPLALKHMNNVFRLLLWVKVCERSVYRWCNKEITSVRAHGIKQQMIQFLRQFQFYAAHFVIEPGWSKLMGRMSSADDVLSISHALQDFFDNLEHGLILSTLPRFRSLAKILDLMSRFGDLSKVASSSGRRNDTASMDETLNAIHDNFLKLLAELANPRGEDYPQLVPLLTWIDFSRYYDHRNVYRVQQGATSSQTAEVSAMAAARMAAQQQQQRSSSSRSGSVTLDPNAVM